MPNLTGYSIHYMGTKSIKFVYHGAKYIFQLTWGYTFFANKIKACFIGFYS